MPSNIRHSTSVDVCDSKTIPHWLIFSQHFHKFIDVMNEQGLDLSKAEISKAEAALWGWVWKLIISAALYNFSRIEHIKKYEKKKAKVVKSGKEGAKTAVHKVGRIGHSGGDRDTWRRDVLEGRKKPKGTHSSVAVSRQASSDTSGNQEGEVR